jgi:hypothetical protein
MPRELSEEWLERELNPEILDHEFKTCSLCKQDLPLRKFYVGSSRCRTCISEKSKQLRQDNPAKTAWERARARAKKNGTEFTITQEDVEAVWTNTCPIYQMPLVTNQGKPDGNSHSIDRINNNKGYIPGNIAIVSMRFNSEKRNLSPELLRRMLAYMENNT